MNAYISVFYPPHQQTFFKISNQFIGFSKNVLI